MNIPIGMKIADFVAKAVMPDNSINTQFHLHDYIQGNKAVLFFYPLDFTFVCPSELIALNNKIGDFGLRNTKVIGISVDSHFSHLTWKNMPYDKGGIDKVQFPLVSDLNKEISKSYGILHEGVALRCTIVVDEKMIIRHFGVNDLPVGRNIDEILRILDSIDHFNRYGEVCPAGWSVGKESIKATSDGVSSFLVANADKL